MLLTILLTIGVLFIVGVGTGDESLTLMFTALAFVASAFSTCTVIEKGDEKYAVRDTTDIQSAATGSKLEGDFVLGSGTIEDKRYYAYWTSEDTHRKGAVERRVIEENHWDIEIIETDSIDSQIIFLAYKKEETFWYTWVDSPYRRAEVFVPEGSIRYNYDITAK